ncbi:retron St85 family effector protein [Enterococcus alcedinis]|uniref:retron St85 family effector protein n=1 Tax=Enterococcus alcedinis TaxID=1274384 RepID=UPI003618B585
MSEKIILRNSTKYQLIKIIEIFENLAENMTNIFLCGGASYKNNISFRDKLNDYLASKKNSNVRVFYPEELFISLMNTDKKQNMLDLENFLVHNSDVVCIIAESVGSFVELGAFVNNEVTKEKVVALVEKNIKELKVF